MLIFPKQKRSFIAIPKTGSTSIIYSGSKSYLNFKPEVYHSRSSETMQLLLDNKKDFLNFTGDENVSSDDYDVTLDSVESYLTCAVIRDPIERIRSFFCEFHEGLHAGNASLRKLSPYEFVDYIVNSDDCCLPIHIKPQYLFLDKFSTICLFPFERMGSLWDIFYGHRLEKKLLTHQRATEDYKIRVIFDDFVRKNKTLVEKFKLRYSKDYKIHSLLLDHSLVSYNKAIQLLSFQPLTK